MDEFEVAVIGAGFAGLCAAVEMRKRKRDSFVVLERAEQLGGTWRGNTYPGVMGTTISDGCGSWSTDRGVNHALWAGSSLTYRMLLADVRRHHFCFIEAA